MAQWAEQTGAVRAVPQVLTGNQREREGHVMGKHTGGSRFGRVQNSWPFVKLLISDDSVSMRTMLQDVEIKRPFIETIVVRRSFLNHRFIFIHNDPAIKKEVEFWTFSPRPVADDLRSHGYPVSEESR